MSMSKPIIGGPSKFDLMLGLFDFPLRTVVFKLGNVGFKDTKTGRWTGEDYPVFIQQMKRVNATADHWRIEGIFISNTNHDITWNEFINEKYGSGRPATIDFNSQTRKGKITFSD